MRRFVIDAVRFSALLSTTALVTVTGNLYLMESDVFRVPPGTNTVILGDSHSVYAFDTARIRSSVNVAQEGEPYLLTFRKLELILSENPDLRHVVVSFSPHHISEFNERKFKDPPWTEYIFDSYYPVLEWGDLEEFEVDWGRAWQAILQNVVVPNTEYLRNVVNAGLDRGTRSYPYVGSYVELFGSNLDRRVLAERIERHFVEGGRVLGVSQKSVSHLERVVELTRAQGLDLHLVATPLHEEYQQRSPRSILEEYERLWAGLEAVGFVHMYRLSDLNLPPSHFFDFDHVNASGARLVSSALDDMMQDVRR